MSDALMNFNQNYFAALLALMNRSGIELATPRKPYSEHRQVIDSWPGNIDSAAKILKSKNEVSVDLTLKSGSADDQFLILEKEKHSVQEIVGGMLDWNNAPDKDRLLPF